jgi:hypothetical protein
MILNQCPMGGEHDPVIIRKNGIVTVVCRKCRQVV